ncbi:MAG: hypothetical protein ACTS78_00285 [Arsenophonus sp. NC-WZS1-MAG3]
MRKAIIYQFSLSIESGMILGQRKLKTCDGFLISFIGNNFQGWNEISPLSEFSIEILEIARGSLQADLYDWVPWCNKLKSAIFHQCILGLVVRRLN